jgi:hypothetical protein
MSAFLLFFKDDRGQLGAQLGVDLAALGAAEGEQLIRIDYDPAGDDALRLQAREFLRHRGFPLLESGKHIVVADLANAIIVLTSKPSGGDGLAGAHETVSSEYLAISDCLEGVGGAAKARADEERWRRFQAVWPAELAGDASRTVRKVFSGLSDLDQDRAIKDAPGYLSARRAEGEAPMCAKLWLRALSEAS